MNDSFYQTLTTLFRGLAAIAIMLDGASIAGANQSNFPLNHWTALAILALLYITVPPHPWKWDDKQRK